MLKQAHPISPGVRPVTAPLVHRRAGKAIEVYKKAFCGKEGFRVPRPGGASLLHAEIEIGDSIVMLTDENPGMGAVSPLTLKGTSTSLLLYVPDVDQAWKRAVDAGCKVKMPLGDQFWGDRYGNLEDPFGH